uniref:Uncharacterized protein n=1 Tax=Ananas comosus var. bracteatus TaxID=296719 RepID=A0A6V7Q7B4_ANACO|nr:unnamed protein product [Ananas comosus var. bracteatus]
MGRRSCWRRRHGGGKRREGRQVQGREAPRHEPPRGDAHHARPTKNKPRRSAAMATTATTTTTTTMWPRSTRAPVQLPEELPGFFSIDTVVKPLPPAMAYNVSRNLHFFLRIFTQFWDPEGIAGAQKSLGLGQEEKGRRVR